MKIVGSILMLMLSATTAFAAPHADTATQLELQPELKKTLLTFVTGRFYTAEIRCKEILEKKNTANKTSCEFNSIREPKKILTLSEAQAVELVPILKGIVPKGSESRKDIGSTEIQITAYLNYVPTGDLLLYWNSPSRN